MSALTRDSSQQSDVYDGAPHPRESLGLVGHRAAEAELLDAYRAGRLAQAWLIGGPEGVGKATLAWRFARFVLAHPDPQSPAVRGARDLFVDPGAPAARQIAVQAHPDLASLRRAWNAERKNFYTDIRVDDVRGALQMFHLSAGAGGWRVCIVDTAEDLNPSSANALLKMIEEPPARALFLILAHRPGLTLSTIRSRCRRLQLEPLSPEEIVTIVRGFGAPWSEIDEEALAAAAQRANGSVREALRRIDPDGAEFEAMVAAAVERLPQSDDRLVHRLADAVAARGRDGDFETLSLALYDWLANRARDKAGEGAARLASIAELWDKA
ncbi:MAG TPA: DNA polymerase III subunit delta', partial [Roseiarcus sp.]|nr:DNA polymerase III subunit delta' [Roseiarcus sp.]